MQQEGQIASLIMDSCPSKKSRSQLTTLLSAFADIVRKKENKELPEVPEGTGAYTEATCYEFHQLLVASLMAYANALGALSEAECNWQNHPGTEAMKMRESCAERVWQCTYLLWRIVYSQIFRQHLTLLARGAWLLPLAQGDKDVSAADLCLTPGVVGHRFRACKNDKSGTGVKGGDVGGSTKDDDASPLEQDADANDVDGGMEEDDDTSPLEGDLDANDMDDDLAKAKPYMTWFRLHVSPWASQEIISSFSDALKGSQNVKLHLLAAEPLNTANMAMEDWETTIRNLASWQPTGEVTNTFDADTIIGRIKMHIREYVQIADVNPIFRAFRDHKPEFSGVLHCEIVLSILAAYADILIGDRSEYQRRLNALLKVRSSLRNYGIN
jgi:hypothetical protein